MSDQAKCPTCQGRGHYEDYEGGEMVRCDACNGTGYAPVDTSEPQCPDCKHDWEAHSVGSSCIGNRNLCGCTTRIPPEPGKCKGCGFNVRHLTGNCPGRPETWPTGGPTPPSDEVGLCPWCGTMKHLNHIGLCGRCFDPTADSTVNNKDDHDEEDRIPRQRLDTHTHHWVADKTHPDYVGCECDPKHVWRIDELITKLQREAVVTALERVKKHKYWVSGDPANPFVSHDVIDAEIERFTAK